MTFTRDLAETLARRASHYHTLEGAGGCIYDLGSMMPPGGWRDALIKTGEALQECQSCWSLFTYGGNTKLPFVSWSTLPGLLKNGGTCAGAGECLEWCYSYKAWRYPQGFCRQLQNTLILRHAPELVASAWLLIPANSTVRLYVDGDYDSVRTVRFWFNLCDNRPDLSVYGYSKSWVELIEAGDYPDNYKLNLSNGSCHGDQLRDTMLTLPITRGGFHGVEVPKGDWPKGFARYDDKSYHKAVREAAKEAGLGKVFSCPGKCGTCTPHGHACGSERFQDVTIAIGVH